MEISSERIQWIAIAGSGAQKTAGGAPRERAPAAGYEHVQEGPLGQR
jgi:hypothetical protein